MCLWCPEKIYCKDWGKERRIKEWNMYIMKYVWNIFMQNLRKENTALFFSWWWNVLWEFQVLCGCWDVGSHCDLFSHRISFTWMIFIKSDSFSCDSYFTWWIFHTWFYLFLGFPWNALRLVTHMKCLWFFLHLVISFLYNI